MVGESDPEARLPLVIAIHGLGDSPEAFLELFDGFGGRARVVALRGLDAWRDGWSWFGMDDDPATPAFARGLESSADRVAQAIAEVAQVRPTCGRLVITGFSQGGMLSYTLAARHPEIRALYVPIAGRLSVHTEIHPGPRDAEVRGLHGTADARVPIDGARSAVARLNLASVSARLEEYPGIGHAISGAMRRELFRVVGHAVAGGCQGRE